MDGRKYYEAYDERYKTAHTDGIRWFGADPSPIVGQIMEKYAVMPWMELLELGCGEGRDACALLKDGYRLLATDISPEAIRYCQKLMPEHSQHFCVLDCVKGTLPQRFDFIYAVAVVHMLLLDEDRNGFYQFIYAHLAPDGLALICSMGDGTHEYRSDVSKAYELQERTHAGKTLLVAGTSCAVVSAEIFAKELAANNLMIVEQGQTSIPNEFPQMMYAVVKKQTEQ